MSEQAIAWINLMLIFTLIGSLIWQVWGAKVNHNRLGKQMAADIIAKLKKSDTTLVIKEDNRFHQPPRYAEYDQ